MRFPERHRFELNALRNAGIEFKRDEEAFSQGILRLHVVVDFEGERLNLIVTYPELYPYFRFEVAAPALSLPHHQHPFGKNLCLIGRGTHHWQTTDTAAGLLAEKLANVLQTGRAAGTEVGEGTEQRQAEPFSDYYACEWSMVVLPGGWKVPAGHDCGTFSVATIGPQGPPPKRFLRGAMVEVRGRGGDVLVAADAGICSAFPGQRIQGFWVRVPKPIEQGEPEKFLNEVFGRSPGARNAQANRVDGGFLKVWGVAFPEENAWRKEGGEGWVFVCRFDTNANPAVPLTENRLHRHSEREGKRQKKKRERQRRKKP